MAQPEAPVAAQYIVTFLKPEMLHIYRQVCALKAFRPVVFCQKRENPDSFPFEDLQVLGKPRTHQLRRFWQKQILRRPITIYRSEAKRIVRELEAVEARVLHVYFGHIGIHLLPLLRICPVPAVLSFHGADVRVGLDDEAHREAMQEALQLAQLALVRSESLAAGLIELGCPEGKIRVHRTGVPLDEISATVRTPPAEGGWRLVQACRLIPKKGLATTLRAFQRFHAQFPKAMLTIAGDGPQKVHLESMVAAAGLQGSVRFPGFLSQERLRALYAESHLFLHPSEKTAEGDQEGIPNSMLEAMASGLPPLATRHGGIPEAVAHGVSGLLVEERDDAALADALITLAKDPALYAAMSVETAKQAREQFDLGRQTRTLEGYYREACGTR